MAEKNYVSMEMDDEEKVDHAIPVMTEDGPKRHVPEFPYGLRICFDEKQLEKLGLDIDDVSHGDFVMLLVKARVTEKSETEGTDYHTGEKNKRERVELQIEQICLDCDDDEEAEGEK